MIKLISYAKRFFTDETGNEFLQYAIIVVMSVALIAAVTLLKNAIDGKIRDSAEEVNDFGGNTSSSSGK